MLFSYSQISSWPEIPGGSGHPGVGKDVKMPSQCRVAARPYLLPLRDGGQPACRQMRLCLLAAE